MRKMLALLGTAAIMTAPMAAIAHDMDDDYEAAPTLCSYCWEKGEFTSNNPEASRVLLFPVRVATGAVGAPIGALSGMGIGAADAVEATSKATFGNIRTTEYDSVTNGVMTTLKAPVLLPVGLVGTIVALPVGMTYGAVAGTFKGFAKGYMYPDSW